MSCISSTDGWSGWSAGRRTKVTRVRRRQRPWTRGRATLAPALPAAVALLLGPPAAAAQTTLLQREGATFTLGGYARTLAGAYHVGDRWRDADPTSGVAAQVVRLKWRLELGPRVAVHVDDRLQLQASTARGGWGSSVAGFGVSAVPGRSVDLSTDLISRERVRGWHDVDRLSVTVRAGAADVTAGRQAISWGVSNLFPVADLWAGFSPFELDTEEKPGSDAVRVLAYPGRGWEVDLVVADRGRREDLSVAVRAAAALSRADLYLAAGKLWNQRMALGGVEVPVGSWKLRAEGALPWDTDADAWLGARATLGVDWLRGEWMLSGEAHHNGLGAVDAAGYPAVLADPRFTRGESYFLGRTYAGALVAFTPGNDRLSFTFSALVNVRDPSAALTPVATYDLGQSLRISAGAMLTPGAAPAHDPLPRLRSEYGSYGQFAFTRVSVYF